MKKNRLMIRRSFQSLRRLELNADLAPGRGTFRFAELISSFKHLQKLAIHFSGNHEITVNWREKKNIFLFIYNKVNIRIWLTISITESFLNVSTDYCLDRPSFIYSHLKILLHPVQDQQRIKIWNKYKIVMKLLIAHIELNQRILHSTDAQKLLNIILGIMSCT